MSEIFHWLGKILKEKKFEEADKVRIEVQKLGYDIEDTARGPHAKALHPRV